LRRIDKQKQINSKRERQSAFQALIKSARETKEAQRKARENEAGTKATIARTTKKCPKVGCGNRIERKGGCTHFLCPKCKTEFCWNCKVIWKNKKPIHVDTCHLAKTRTIARSALDTLEYAHGWDKDEGYDTTLDSDLWIYSGHE